MSKLARLGTLVATMGTAVLTTSSFAHAQVVGAVQYPPASVGKDAQPPPPAGMIPQRVSPRRIESSSAGPASRLPALPPSSRVWPDTGRHTPSLGLSPSPPPTQARISRSVPLSVE